MNLEIEIILGLTNYFSEKYEIEKNFPSSTFFNYYKKEFIRIFFPVIEDPYNHLNEYFLIEKSDKYLDNLSNLGHPFDKYSYHLKNSIKRLKSEQRFSYYEKYHLFDCPESIFQIYNRIKEIIKSINDKIEVKPVKSYIGFHISEIIILTLNLKQEQVEIHFSEPKEKFKDPKNKLEEIVLESSLHGRNNSKFTIKTINEIPYALDLINQNFQIKKEDLEINL